MNDQVEREIKISWADRIIGLAILVVLCATLMPLTDWYYYPYLFIATALCIIVPVVVVCILVFVGGKKNKEER